MRLAVILKLRIRVRRGNDMSDAVSIGDPAHLLGNIPGRRAIVNHRENVTVDINHDGRECW